MWIAARAADDRAFARGMTDAADWPDLAGRVGADGAHVLPVRVYFEDTDAGGVVYHASYLRFLERGRTDFIRVLGIRQSDLAEGEEAALFLVRRMEIDFRRPARLDDVIEVVTRPGALGGASITLEQSVRKDTETLVSARVKVALVTRDGRPARIRGALREMLGGG
jgi:acyl-CoA thioester hydrolase